uniref:Uncharacterized protein n=1 Tax=Oryza barthii TaxID=65489 RepID=A0A0D3GZL2_9ORYZ
MSTTSSSKTATCPLCHADVLLPRRRSAGSSTHRSHDLDDGPAPPSPESSCRSNAAVCGCARCRRPDLISPGTGMRMRNRFGDGPNRISAQSGAWLCRERTAETCRSTSSRSGRYRRLQPAAVAGTRRAELIKRLQELCHPANNLPNCSASWQPQRQRQQTIDRSPDSLDCGVTMERGKNKRDGSDNGLIFSNLMHGVAAGIYGYTPHQGYTQAQSYLLLPEAYPPPPWTYPLSSAYPPQPVGYPSGGYPPAVYSDSYVHQGSRVAREQCPLSYANNAVTGREDGQMNCENGTANMEKSAMSSNKMATGLLKSCGNVMPCRNMERSGPAMYKVDMRGSTKQFSMDSKMMMCLIVFGCLIAALDMFRNVA